MSENITIKSAFLQQLENHLLLPSARSVPHAWSVLIVDSFTITVVSGLVKATDLLKYNIVLIDSISTSRDPMSGMHALYYLQPTLRNVQEIANDFAVDSVATENVEVVYEDTEGDTDMGCCGCGGGKTTKKTTTVRKSIPVPLYTSGQVFWASPPSKAVQEALANPALTGKIRGISVVPAPGIPVDARAVQTLSSPDLVTLFHRRGSPELRKNPLVGAELAAIVRALATATGCTGKATIHAATNSLIANEVAQATGAALDLIGEDETAAAAAVVVVLDRGVDLLGPLLHSFRVGALAADLLGATGLQYQPREGPVANLDVNANPLWGRYRQMLHSEAGAAMKVEFDQFRNRNQALVQQELVNSADAPSAPAPDPATMRQMLSAMPTFTRDKANYGSVIEILTEIRQKYDSRNLRDLALFEQDLACGDDNAEHEEGQNIVVGINNSRAWARTLGIVASSQCEESDAVRLGLISLLSLSPGVSQPMQQELFTEKGGKFTSVAFRGLETLASTVQSTYRNVWSAPQEQPPIGTAAGVACLAAGRPAGLAGAPQITPESPSQGLAAFSSALKMKKPVKVARRDTDRAAIPWSRYVPTLSFIARDLVAGGASFNNDIAIVRKGGSSITTSVPISYGVGAARRRWRSDSTPGTGSAAGATAAPRVGRPPLVFYVAGGASFEEILLATRLSSDSTFPYEVFIAGPAPLTPSSYIQQLIKLGQT